MLGIPNNRVGLAMLGLVAAGTAIGIATWWHDSHIEAPSVGPIDLGPVTLPPIGSGGDAPPTGVPTPDSGAIRDALAGSQALAEAGEASTRQVITDFASSPQYSTAQVVAGIEHLDHDWGTIRALDVDTPTLDQLVQRSLEDGAYSVTL